MHQSTTGRATAAADADVRERQVDSAGASLTYGDDFYGCIVNHDQFVAFDGLDNQTAIFAGFDH